MLEVALQPPRDEERRGLRVWFWSWSMVARKWTDRAGLKAVQSVQLHRAPGAWGRQNVGFNHFLVIFHSIFWCLLFL